MKAECVRQSSLSVAPYCPRLAPIVGASVQAAYSVCSPPHETRACPGFALECTSRASPTCGGEGLGVGVAARTRRHVRAGCSERHRVFGLLEHRRDILGTTTTTPSPTPSPAGCGLARFRHM